ncbi:MAG: DUF3014 domain-containing protein [Steroidobacteraceae bacterium]
MRHRLVVGALVAIAAAVGLALLFWPKRMAAPPPPPATGPTLAAEPGPEHPLPASAPPGEPLPALADSDTFVVDALGDVIGAQPARDFVATPGVVRRLVVTVDSLARGKVPLLTRAVGALPGTLVVTRDGERIFLGEDNYARYAPYVQVISQLDIERLAALYRRLYPLLQQAYGEVGRPGAYFNDRVIAVIDDLLATPTVAGPIELEQPSVYYRYKDPALEARSAGQRLLLRMGPAHAGVVKDKLMALRALLARPSGELPPQ